MRIVAPGALGRTQPIRVTSRRLDRLGRGLQEGRRTDDSRPDDLLARLLPSTDAHKVAQLLAATTETVNDLGTHGNFPLRATSDFPQIVAALSVQGRALEPGRLLALASFLESVDESRIAIRQGGAPILERLSAGAASFKNEIGHVRKKIDAQGDEHSIFLGCQRRVFRAVGSRDTGRLN